MSIAGVILSGGKSSRFGSPKALAPWNGKTLLENWFDAFSALGCRVIGVVAAQEIQKFSQNLAQPLGLIWINQEDSEAPPFSSIKKGIAKFSGGENAPEGIWLTPVDVLPPDPRTLQKLLEETKKIQGDVYALRPRDRSSGSRGHPVFLTRAFMKVILDADEKKARLDHLLRAHEDKIINIDVDDPKILSNVNTVQNLTE